MGLSSKLQVRIIQKILAYVAAFFVCCAIFWIFVFTSKLVGSGFETMLERVIAAPSEQLALGLKEWQNGWKPSDANMVAIHKHIESAHNFVSNSIIAKFGLILLVPVWALANSRYFQRILDRWTGIPPEFLHKPSIKENTPAIYKEIREKLELFRRDPRPTSIIGMWGADPESINTIVNNWLLDMRKQGWHVGRFSGGAIPNNWQPSRPTIIYYDQYCDTFEELSRRLALLVPFISGTPDVKVRIVISSAVNFGEQFRRQSDVIYDRLIEYIFDAMSEAKQRPPTFQNKIAVSENEFGRAGRSFLVGAVKDTETEDRPFVRVPVRDKAQAANEFVDRAARLFGSDGLKLAALSGICGPAPATVRLAVAPMAADIERLDEIFPNNQHIIKFQIPETISGTEFETVVQSLSRLQSVDITNFARNLFQSMPEAAQDFQKFLSFWHSIIPFNTAGPKMPRDGSGVELIAAAKTLASITYSEEDIVQWFPDEVENLYISALSSQLNISGENLRTVLHDPIIRSSTEWKNGLAIGHLFANFARLSDGMVTPKIAQELSQGLFNLAIARLDSLDSATGASLLKFLTRENNFSARNCLFEAIANDPAWFDYPDAVKFVVRLFGLNNQNEEYPDKMEDKPDSIRRALEAFVLLDQAYIANQPDEFSAVSERAHALESQLISQLKSTAPIDQISASWALWWVSGAGDYRDVAYSLSATLLEAVVDAASRSTTADVAWRYLVDIIIRSDAEMAASRFHILALAESIDKHDTFEEIEVSAQLKNFDVISECQRRSKSQFRYTRVAASTYRLLTGSGQSGDSREVMNFIRRGDGRSGYNDMLFLALLIDGGDESREELLNAAATSRGKIQSVALLALRNLGSVKAFEYLIEITDPVTVARHFSCFNGFVDKTRLVDTVKRSSYEPSSVKSRIQMEATVCILLVRGEDPNGKAIFAYVGVRADMLESFMKAQSTGLFYPEEHGVIVESGYGEPTEEIRNKMSSEYGFDHDGMIDIPDHLHADAAAISLTAKAAKDKETEPN